MASDFLRRIADDDKMSVCIHCGFCLPACPSYSVLVDEADSPRGRIYFMRALAQGRAEPTEAMRQHFDRCLSCFSCETACPSGIKYRELIEDAREWLACKVPPKRPLGWRWFFMNILPNALVLRLAMTPLWAAQCLGLRGLAEWAGRMALPAWMGDSLRLLPRKLPPPFVKAMPKILPARGEKKMRVGLFLGCVMEGLFPRINRLTAELLRELGCEVVVPRGQGCCGALAFHISEREEGEKLAKRVIAAFEGEKVDAIVVNAAGCGSTMKDYGRYLEGEEAKKFSALVRDFSEVAVQLLADRPPTHEVRLRVAYQEACHLGHAQRVNEEPRAVLRSIPGIEFVELPEQELCCGSAGVYNILQPAVASELRSRKVNHLRAAGADVLVTANPGCYLQLQEGIRGARLKVPVMHEVELLAMGFGFGGRQRL